MDWGQRGVVVANIMIIAGGTGGHIFPALAVAQRLAKAGHHVSWLGARYGMEAKLVGPHFPIDFVDMEGVRKRGWQVKVLAPWRLIKAILAARQIIKTRQPRVVLAMGGYVAAAGGIAAFLARIPLVIHEQNARAGLSNRCLAVLAAARLQAFPNAFSSYWQAKTVGNPVREAFWLLADPRERYQDHAQGPLRVLILGGSQGARAINQAWVAALRLYPQLKDLSIWHQAGEKDLAAMQEAYSGLALDLKLTAFIEDAAAAYAWADLVICRAGAMTVSELAAAGVASLLVPYPEAVDNHQFYNAKFLADPGAGILVEQKSLTAAAIVEALTRFVANRRDLLIMAQAARQIAQRSATDRVAEACLKFTQ